MSDTVSNGIRVIKTYKQTHPQNITYSRTIKEILLKDNCGMNLISITDDEIKLAIDMFEEI